MFCLTYVRKNKESSMSLQHLWFKIKQTKNSLLIKMHFGWIWFFENLNIGVGLFFVDKHIDF